MKIKKPFLIVITSLIFGLFQAHAQADLLHFQFTIEPIMLDSVNPSDSVEVTLMMKLTDKTNTNSIYLDLGTGKDKGDIKSMTFTISNKGDKYIASNTEFGNIEINGRVLIIRLEFHKDVINELKWASAYMLRADKTLSTKHYYPNYYTE